ncbi:sensor histidine kinase [Erysipelotrichaceae bacterium HCN-30851]
MKYLKKHAKFLISTIFLIFAFNAYYIFLIPHTNIQYLLYLDFLCLVFYGLFIGIDAYFFYQKEKEKEALLQSHDIISTEYDSYENADITQHDLAILQQLLDNQLERIQDLQDYIAKWCHEVKIPLSALLLMNEKNENEELKQDMKEQLERIKIYLNNALVGCKAQSNLYDLSIQKVNLKECIQTSIKNNRFFFIKKHFDIQLDIEDVTVFSDTEWLVYIFDQIFANAIKYTKENAYLHIWTKQKQDSIYLFIEDHGEGIQDYDLPRIFERGYTGHNHHNGKYKSTGMGLYLVKLMTDKLDHGIFVESEVSRYTRFTIKFKDNRKHFYL